MSGTRERENMLVQKKLPNSEQAKVEFEITNSAKCELLKKKTLKMAENVIISKMDRGNLKVLMTFIIIIFLQSKFTLICILNVSGNILLIDPAELKLRKVYTSGDVYNLSCRPSM